MENFFSKNLKHLRHSKKLTQEKMGNYIGKDYSTIGKWENGDRSPSMEDVIKVSHFFNVPIDEMIGHDLTEIKPPNETTSEPGVKVPILGKIPAGIPIEAVEDVLGWEELPQSWFKGNKEWFCLKITGDSMYPEYRDGDVIVLQKTSDFHSGQDCVVMVNGGDATFKRVFKNNNTLMLSPLNKKHSPLIFTDVQVMEEPVTVIGVAKEIRRKV